MNWSRIEVYKFGSNDLYQTLYSKEDLETFLSSGVASEYVLRFV